MSRNEVSGRNSACNLGDCSLLDSGWKYYTVQRMSWSRYKTLKFLQCNIYIFVFPWVLFWVSSLEKAEATYTTLWWSLAAAYQGDRKTPRKFNSSPQTHGAWKTIPFLFEKGTFRGELSNFVGVTSPFSLPQGPAMPFRGESYIAFRSQFNIFNGFWKGPFYAFLLAYISS